MVARGGVRGFLVFNGFVLGCVGLVGVEREDGFLVCGLERLVVVVSLEIGLVCFLGEVGMFVLVVILLTADLSFGAAGVCGEDGALLSGRGPLLLVAI